MRVPFSPPPGVNSDDTTFSAEGRWADGNNVRFRGGRPEVIGGWSSFSLTAASGTPIALHFWTLDSGTTYVACGTSTSKLYIYNSTGTRFDITPSGIDEVGTGWSLSTWGDSLLAANSDGLLYEWIGNTANPATVISEAPGNIISMLVTSSRQCIVFGCDEELSGDFNGMCIRGCDFEDLTDWTSSSDNNAFEVILDGDGIISNAKAVGDYILVWTNTSLYLGTFIGDPSQTYRFDKIADGCGLGSGLPNSKASGVVVVNQTAFWVSPDKRFFSYTLGGLPAPMACPILKEFQENSPDALAPGNIMGFNGRFNEVWYFYIDSREGTGANSRYVAYSIAEDCWFRGQMARSAWHDAGVAIYAADPSGNIYKQELGKSAVNSAITWHITSADQYIENGERELMLTRFEPDFEGQTGNVNLTINVRNRPQNSATAKGPYTLATTTLKTDFRITGRIFSVKLASSGATQSYMRLGKPVFEATVLGKGR